MADVRTPELVINKLTKQQYENIQNPSDTEIYLVSEDEEHKPICYPTTASEVKTTSMVVKSCVSDNGKILIENGFVYNTSGNPTVSDTKVICDLGAGFMEKKLKNLTLNTEYHIKSYGQNSSGISYGSELVQMTLPSPIPNEYQLVEYLSGNYDAYICIENLTFDSIETIVTFLDLGTTSGIFGWRDSRGTNYPALGLFVTSNNVPRTDFNSTQNNRNYSLGTHIIISDNISGKVYDNGIEFMTYTPINVLMTLFGLFTAYYSTTPMNASKMYLHKFKLGNQIELYPVYRIADNKPGMYDIVNDVFYINQGTGEFTVGPDKEWDE